jgi:hypothetical protein
MVKDGMQQRLPRVQLSEIVRSHEYQRCACSPKYNLVAIGALESGKYLGQIT